MKKLLIGCLLLSSVTVYASEPSCTVTLTGDAVSNKIQKILKRRFKEIKNYDADYVVDISSDHFLSSGTEFLTANITVSQNDSVRSFQINEEVSYLPDLDFLIGNERAIIRAVKQIPIMDCN